MKKLLLILLALSLAEAKTFEQAFNIQSIKPKMQAQKVSKTYYATTAYSERKIYEVNIRFDGYIEKLDAYELYKSVKRGDKLFDVAPKHLHALKKEFEFAKDDEETKAKILQKLKDCEIDEKVLTSSDLTIPIYSKFSGQIIEKNIFVGSYAEMGEALLKIADTSFMWIMAKVYQKDLEFIAQGMSVNVEIEGLSAPISAKVGKIYPKINKEDLTFDVRMEVANPHGKIFPDMFAKVSFTKNQNSSLTLPKDAVIKRGDKFYIFKKISQSEYEPQEVDAKYGGGYYQISRGIDESSEVAQNALFLLDSDAVTNGSYMSEKW